MNRSALILAAHGAGDGTPANDLVRELARQLALESPFGMVRAAFNLGTPRFREVIDGTDADDITVVPLMTSEGYFNNSVLPRELARNARYLQVRLRVTPPVGIHSAVADLALDRAATAIAQFNLDAGDTAVVLVGHGTPRDQGSRNATEKLRDALRTRSVFGRVEAAFLDDGPRIEVMPATLSESNVVVVPFLIGGGYHAARDIPLRLGARTPDNRETWPFAWGDRGRQIVCTDAVGTHPRLVAVIRDLARRSDNGKPAQLGRTRSQPGVVYLVGAGPGDPGLITVKGLEALRSADVVLHDRLVPRELLAEVRPDARVIDVGKAPGRTAWSQAGINEKLIEAARSGRTVVRLKGGDPFVFGRGAEEASACASAGIRCVVVPGVSSAIAVPAAAGIPVTHRAAARSFAVITGRTEDDEDLPPHDYDALARIDTLVLLMGRSNLRQICEALLAAGRDPLTPAAAIASGTTDRQRVVTATLASIADAADQAELQPPVTTVVGETAAFAQEAVTENAPASSNEAHAKSGAGRDAETVDLRRAGQTAEFLALKREADVLEASSQASG